MTIELSELVLYVAAGLNIYMAVRSMIKIKDVEKTRRQLDQAIQDGHTRTDAMETIDHATKMGLELARATVSHFIDGDGDRYDLVAMCQEFKRIDQKAIAQVIYLNR